MQALLVAGIFLSSAVAAGSGPAAPLPTEQESQVNQLVQKYLLSHPEILVKMIAALENPQPGKQNADMINAVIRDQKVLLDASSAPSDGPASARVTVVEFFDYQCIWCAKVAPVLEKSRKNNPSVRFIFRDWPVFAGRWERSKTAAETGLQIWQQKGASAYLQYYHDLFATGHNEGAMTTEDIWQAAGKVKFDSHNVKNVMPFLENNSHIAQITGFRGTPGLVVMPSTGATERTVSVFAGMPTEGALQDAINRAASKALPGQEYRVMTTSSSDRSRR